MTSLLRTRFATQESVQSLNSAFHSRHQLEDETFAEYSRILMRLYSRLESVAVGREREAFALLRDTTLKGQLIRGVRDPQMRRELRRIEMANDRYPEAIAAFASVGPSREFRDAKAFAAQ